MISPTSRISGLLSGSELFKLLGPDQSPEQLLKEENELLKAQLANQDALIENLTTQVESLRELLALQDKRDTWFQPMSDRIVELEKKVAELSRLGPNHSRTIIREQVN